jgi:hypothetical protein
MQYSNNQTSSNAPRGVQAEVSGSQRQERSTSTIVVAQTQNEDVDQGVDQNALPHDAT